MVSGALSQSLPEFSEELSIRLGSGAGRSGLVDFQRPQGRGSQPPSCRRNMVGVCNEPPNSGAASWHCLDSQVWGLRVSSEATVCSGSEEQVSAGESYSEFRSGSPLPWMVMQPQVCQAACFLYSFEVKEGTSKFIHHHHPAHKIPKVSGSDEAWVTPTVSSLFSRFLSQQAAPQVSLTKPTSQGAPATGEEVLPRRKEGRKVALGPRCSGAGES